DAHEQAGRGEGRLRDGVEGGDEGAQAARVVVRRQQLAAEDADQRTATDAGHGNDVGEAIAVEVAGGDPGPALEGAGTVDRDAVVGGDDAARGGRQGRILAARDDLAGEDLDERAGGRTIEGNDDVREAVVVHIPRRHEVTDARVGGVQVEQGREA